MEKKIIKQGEVVGTKLIKTHEDLLSQGHESDIKQGLKDAVVQALASPIEFEGKSFVPKSVKDECLNKKDINDIIEEFCSVSDMGDYIEVPEGTLIFQGKISSFMVKNLLTSRGFIHKHSFVLDFTIGEYVSIVMNEDTFIVTSKHFYCYDSKADEVYRVDICSANHDFPLYQIEMLHAFMPVAQKSKVISLALVCDADKQYSTWNRYTPAISFKENHTAVFEIRSTSFEAGYVHNTYGNEGESPENVNIIPF